MTDELRSPAPSPRHETYGPIEYDVLTLCLRLCLEPADTHSPEVHAVMDHYRPAWEAAAGGMPFDQALALVPSDTDTLREERDTAVAHANGLTDLIRRMDASKCPHGYRVENCGLCNTEPSARCVVAAPVDRLLRQAWAWLDTVADYGSDATTAGEPTPNSIYMRRLADEIHAFLSAAPAAQPNAGGAPIDQETDWWKSQPVEEKLRLMTRARDSALADAQKWMADGSRYRWLRSYCHENDGDWWRDLGDKLDTDFDTAIDETMRLDVRSSK